jgi:hypothetical protein
MEPERKIEKMLRAYAEKRRAAAGEPMKMHPATRRLLQGEAARAAPKPKAEDASVSLWQLLRRQWAVLLGFALVIFLATPLFLPALAGAKRKAQTVHAVNNLKEIGLAAKLAAEDNNGKLPVSLDALTNGLITETVLNDPSSGQRFVYLGGGEDLDNLQSNALLAYSPADKNGREVLFADGRVEFANRARFSQLTNQKSFQLAFAKNLEREPVKQLPAETLAASELSAATKAPPKLESDNKEKASKSADLGVDRPVSGEFATSKSEATDEERRRLEPPPPAAAPAMMLDDRLSTTQRLTYRNTATQNIPAQVARDNAGAAAQPSGSGGQSAFRNSTASPQAVPVLANFQVQQNGTALRVVDADGSVYAGTLLMAGTNAQIVSVQAEESTVAKDSRQQTVQAISFQVTGISQALKQKVVFTGNIEPMPASTANSQEALHGVVAGAAGKQNQQNSANLSQQTWLSNTRIVGTAIIAPTNQIEINAVPTSP